MYELRKRFLLKMVNLIEQKTFFTDCNNNVQLKAALQIMLTDYLQKRKLLLQVIKAIRQLYRQETYKKNMVSIPGIGEINAAIILFELRDINRFKNFLSAMQLCRFYTRYR